MWLRRPWKRGENQRRSWEKEARRHGRGITSLSPAWWHSCQLAEVAGGKTHLCSRTVLASFPVTLRASLCSWRRTALAATAASSMPGPLGNLTQYVHAVPPTADPVLWALFLSHCSGSSRMVKLLQNPQPTLRVCSFPTAARAPFTSSSRLTSQFSTGRQGWLCQQHLATDTTHDVPRCGWFITFQNSKTFSEPKQF